jgi:hypothetical protein
VRPDACYLGTPITLIPDTWYVMDNDLILPPDNGTHDVPLREALE